MYKEDLALNNLQWLICHKTKPRVMVVVGQSCKLFAEAGAAVLVSAMYIPNPFVTAII